MIGKCEIESKANEFEIHSSNVQRDYVFGWLLFGFFTISELRHRVFLKGGNALRKGYFESTRFSHDLDFGTPEGISLNELTKEFIKVCKFIEAKAGVKFLNDRHKIKEVTLAYEKTVASLRFYDARIYFKDFYGNADHINIRVLIDITQYEKTVLPIQTIPLIHPYSDSKIVNCNIRCMKLEEIVASKLKCLLQRQHAPDLFDYVFSIRSFERYLNRRELAATFLRKTIFSQNPHVAKDILTKTPLQFCRDFWDKTIVCAKQHLIDVETAISFFTKDLAGLFKFYPKSNVSSFAYFGAALRPPIMEAGRTKTCLKIVYDGRERFVEPYSLRYKQRKKDKAELEYLYAYDPIGDNSGPGIKMYLAEKCESIKNTSTGFNPRFPIELSKAGEAPDNQPLIDPSPRLLSHNTRIISSRRLKKII